MNNSKHMYVPAIALTATIGIIPNQASAQEKDATGGRRMNVLFIAVDDLKPTIGAYGDRYAVTPNLDRLASEGCTFMNNYCQMALSGPTRASLMTGLRPDHEGVYSLQGNFRHINPTAVTLPEHLMNNGFQTIGVGKIYHPLNKKKYRNDPKSWSEPYINTSAPTYALANGRVATECVDVPDNFYEDGVIADKAVERMKMLSSSKKPFFLAVGFHRPHMPFVAPKKYWDLYNRDNAPLAEFQSMSSDPVYYAYKNAWEVMYYSDIAPFFSYVDSKHLDEDTQKRLVHGYYASTSYTDANIGRLLDALEENGLKDNTVVIVWGDHGYHLGDHGLWNKSTNFENATRTPMIISVPGMKHGVRYCHVSEFIDIYPTLCELSGVAIPENIDGKSLVPALQNQKMKTKEYAVSQYNRSMIQGYALRDERFRFVMWFDTFRTFMKYDGREVKGMELYDYKTDPLETRNLANDPKYAKTVAKYREAMMRFFDEQYSSPHTRYTARRYADNWK